MSDEARPAEPLGCVLDSPESRIIDAGDAALDVERQNNGQTACTDVSGELVTRIKQSEDDFKRAVIELAQLNGWLVHHGRPAMNRKGAWATWQDGDNGFPDLTLARGGRVILAELKREKAKPSEAQMEWIEALGELACVWYPSMWESIVKILR